MRREKIYKVVPLDFEGEDVQAEGLENALADAREAFGGKEHKVESVRPALTLGGGVATLITDAGRVMLVRDDAASARQIAREESETTADGRTRRYAATIFIGRYLGVGNSAEAVSEKRVIAEGLTKVFFETAMFVQELLGDVPTCLHFDKVELREASIRAQLSRARTSGRAQTVVRFPGSHSAPWFEARGANYFVTVAIETEEPAPEQSAPDYATMFPPLPRRSANVE